MQIYNLKDKIEYLDEVIELKHDEWGKNPKNNRENRLQNKKKKILNQLNDNDFCKLILIDNDKLIVFISIFPHDSDKYNNLTPWYVTMYVKKEYRGKGYSKILNEAILQETKKRGYKIIYLKTELNNYCEKFGAKFIENITNKEKLLKFDL